MRPESVETQSTKIIENQYAHPFFLLVAVHVPARAEPEWFPSDYYAARRVVDLNHNFIHTHEDSDEGNEDSDDRKLT